MHHIEYLLQKLIPASDSHLVVSFFVVFSRFEYALKRSRFVCTFEDGSVKANWDRFASEHEKRFNPLLTPELCEACEYFEANPPKKQIKAEGRLDWENTPSRGSEPLLCWLLRLVRQTRNNLFHGGKFPSGHIDETARNRDLLRHSLTILEACIPLDPDVRQFMDWNEVDRPGASLFCGGATAQDGS
jgi:hypothetical protein